MVTEHDTAHEECRRYAEDVPKIFAGHKLGLKLGLRLSEQVREQASEQAVVQARDKHEQITYEIFEYVVVSAPTLSAYPIRLSAYRKLCQ